MNATRRSFLARVLGGIAGAVAAPFVVGKAAAVVAAPAYDVLTGCYTFTTSGGLPRLSCVVVTEEAIWKIKNLADLESRLRNGKVELLAHRDRWTIKGNQ